ncbi:MAG: glycosyl hydrolase 53 family protein, partial [Chitinophagaceae bacterium]|nr:glycosyl hydrolase 53 family protein [Chitinophagaceae bacterium]
PAAWAGLTLPVLKDSLYNYTLAVLNYLKSKNLTPEMVQVGNEVNGGMCWPVGKVDAGNYDNFSELLKSGIKAVRDFSLTSTIKPKIILHQAQLHSAHWWLQGITAKGVTDFDIVGLSHYSKWATVNSMQAITDTLKALKTRFGKQVMIVETAYPWAAGGSDSYGNIFSATDTAPGYGLSKDEQYRYLKDLALAVHKGGGIGVQYWEPAWISSSMNDGYGIGSSWENCALFDFSGNIMSSAEYMTIKLE